MGDTPQLRMSPALVRMGLLCLVLLCGAASLLSFVLACRAALVWGHVGWTLVWLLGCALGATGFVVSQSLGSVRVWQQPPGRPPAPPPAP